MKFQFNDGGRAAAGFNGTANGDCLCRAIAIATGKPYSWVHRRLAEVAGLDAETFKRAKASDPENGIYKVVGHAFIEAQLKWKFHFLNGNGFLCERDLPLGRLIVAIPCHAVAVIDHVIHDLGNCSTGAPPVWGYWTGPNHEVEVASAKLRIKAEKAKRTGISTLKPR